MKLMMRTAPLLLVFMLVSVNFAHAQGVSAYFGLGTATDSSNKQFVDPPLTDIGPSMGGVFGKFGADFMFRPTLGFGAEYTFRFAQGNYAPQEGLNYRPTFYDFNAIFHPFSGASKRVVPEFQAGLGGVDIKFYAAGQSCVTTNVCQNQSQFLQSSNHFQLHAAAGVRLYVRGSIYIRPQFDIHWVHNFNEFGSGWVPEYGAAIGYTFGGR